MNPLSPKQILRNLENGFFMTHQEQTEAANLIRQLQESNRVLSEGILEYAEAADRLRRELVNISKGLK
jgi:dynactin complex subunit